MAFTQQVKYALQMLMYLDASSSDIVTVKEIARERNLPHNFLQKITQDLARWNILETTRGRMGGVKLKINSSQILVKNVVEALNGPDDHDCIIGESTCTGENPCHVCHHYISHFAQAYYNTSLKDLIDKDHCCKSH